MQDDAGPSALCLVDTDYLAQRRACAVDADCALFTYRPSCCPSLHVAGIARSDLSEAQACAKTTERVVCACDPVPERAEDERVVSDSGPAVARCIAGQCTSRVEQRDCGASHQCGPAEICVSYRNVPGGFPPDPDSGDNALLTFRCEPNPCTDKLACECTQPLCDARNDAIRKCEIKRNTESDVSCEPYQN